MNIHDWTRVPPGMFHHFHLCWVNDLARALNGGVLPPDYYAAAEQRSGGFEPDVVALHRPARDAAEAGGGTALLQRPKLKPVAESDAAAFARRKSRIAVRHASDDRLAAVVEIVSPGNKSSRAAVEALLRKTARFLERKVHAALLDVLPNGPLTPNGLHAAFWEYFDGTPTPATELTFAAYECDFSEIRAYVAEAAVGAPPPDELPLFLEPEGSVPLPVAATYASAFAALPRPWQALLQAAP